jgi:acyl dehydratase
VGHVVGKTRIESIVDKGSQGAFLTTHGDLFDAASSERIASTRATILCRSDGHFGGGDPLVSPAGLFPNGQPDVTCVLPSFGQSALIYRLSGDHNPLHADIRVAQSVGFERPILHGLCTFGMVGHAALHVLCAYDPSRLKKLKLRFSAPFYPGESLKTSFWKLGSGRAAIQCQSEERGVMVMQHGLVEYLE